jgi:mannose/fructose/N-acetylgalactosamine-specific phosphotransferase system component IIB
MGTPPAMDVYFNTVANAIELMPQYEQDPRTGILLTGDIDSMLRLVRNGGVHDVNLGGIHHRAGRRQRLRYVFLTPDEEALLREMAERGATVTAQDVPSARRVDLDELLQSSAEVK